MATLDINEDLRIKSAEKEERCENSESPIVELLEEPCEAERNAGLKVLCETERNITGLLIQDGSAETNFGPDEKSESLADSIVANSTGNTELSVEVTSTSAQPSTTNNLSSDNKQDEESKKSSERRRRGRRGGRGILVRKLASLNLPDGIILVKDNRYTGYHCTYCNCVLRSLATVKAHVDGKWHRRTLQIKVVNDDDKGKNTILSKSVITSQKPSPKIPLKSSLEEYISATKTAVVGLNYITETHRPNKKPTFQCNLCEISCDSHDIKEHINGTKHCLMYLKLVKPSQLAELLAKQLSKAEKNKEIAKLSEELEKENGRGEITVKTVQEKEMSTKQPENRPFNRFQEGGNKASIMPKSGGRPRNRFFGKSQGDGNRLNRPIARTSSNQRSRNFWGPRRGNLQKFSQQKRRIEGMSPAKKRQLLEQDFQAHMQYNMERAQNSFFPGGWGIRNETMDLMSYQNEANFYSNYQNFYSNSFGERRPLNRQRYMNDSYKQMAEFPDQELHDRERYHDRRPYWNDHHDNFISNKPRNYHSRIASPVCRAEHQRNSNVPISALKQLAAFNVTSEEDAGVVINAINSLTNSFMNYKLRDLSRPVQQLIQKSLKGNDLTSLLDLTPDKNAGSARDRHSGRSSQMDQDWGISQIAKPQNWLF